MKIGEPFNPYKLFVGIFIPNVIVRCKIISQGAKIVYGRLNQYAGENGEAYPAIETLANEVGIEERQCIRNLKELEDNGFIQIIRPQGKDKLLHKTNIYKFLWHSIFAPSEVSDMTPLRTDIYDTSGGVGYVSQRESVLKESFNIFNVSNDTICPNGQSPEILSDLKIETKIDKTPYLKIVELYHRHLPYNPKCKLLSSKRKSYIRQRWITNPDLKFWEEYFLKVSGSDFLTGKVENKDGRVFMPDFEWLVKESNFIKVLEGRYEDKDKKQAVYNKRTDLQEYHGGISAAD